MLLRFPSLKVLCTFMQLLNISMTLLMFMWFDVFVAGHLRASKTCLLLFCLCSGGRLALSLLLSDQLILRLLRSPVFFVSPFRQLRRQILDAQLQLIQLLHVVRHLFDSLVDNRHRAQRLEALQVQQNFFAGFHRLTRLDVQERRCLDGPLELFCRPFSLCGRFAGLVYEGHWILALP